MLFVFVFAAAAVAVVVVVVVVGGGGGGGSGGGGGGGGGGGDGRGGGGGGVVVCVCVCVYMRAFVHMLMFSVVYVCARACEHFTSASTAWWPILAPGDTTSTSYTGPFALRRNGLFGYSVTSTQAGQPFRVCMYICMYVCPTCRKAGYPLAKAFWKLD